MKKIYSQPEITVLFIGDAIRTDVISASVRTGTTDTYYSPDRWRNFDIDESWANAGY